MWTQLASRHDLLNLLAGKLESIDGVRETDRLPEKPLMSAELCLVWGSSPRNRISLPTLIIVPDRELRDFLAWTTTFVGGYRPFTAYCRVVERETAHEFEQTRSPFLNKIENVCAAVTIADTLTQLGGQVHPNEVSIATCKSSYSYCMSRGLALNISNRQMETLGEKWALCRKLTKQSDNKVGLESIKKIWKILSMVIRSSDALFAFPDKDADIVEACRQLFTEGSIHPNIWKKITYGHGELTEGVKDMEGIKEQAVVSLERILAKLDEYVYDPFRQSFVCGYLFSLLSSGSLHHLELIRTYLQKYPAAMLWYGACSGLRPGSEITGLFQGLGKRLLRDLLFEDSYLASPRSDIAVEELNVLVSGDSSVDDFKKDSPNRLDVEIAPFISMMVRWPYKKAEPAGNFAALFSSVWTGLFCEVGGGKNTPKGLGNRRHHWHTFPGRCQSFNRDLR